MAEAYSLSFHTVGGNAKIHVDTGYFLQKIIMIIAIPICTLGLLGNVIVFWILCFRIQRTRFTIYFLNMTVADFTVLFHYVISFILFLKAVPISIFYLHLIELVHAFGFNASTYLLTALSAERYVMVFFPTWYQEHRPKHLSAIVCIALWTLSGLISLLLYFSCYVQYDPALAGGTHICESTKMFRVIINILIFLPIMFFTSLLLFIRMTKVAKEPLPTRLDITIVTTVLLFILFSASVRIIDILARWVPAIHIPVLFLVFHFLDSIDSSGNPFVYIFIGYLMKEESGDRPFQEMLERALLDEGSSSYAVNWDKK